MKRLFPRPMHDRWDDYFEPGEVLLWHGQPEPGPHSYFSTIFLSVFGLPFLAAGIFAASQGLGHLLGISGVFDFAVGIFLTAFSLPFLAVGLGLVFGSWLYAFWGHHYTRYALTNKRAYVAKSFPGHSITSYRIAADDAITLDQGRYDNVIFKTFERTDSDGDTKEDSIGFRGITGGREVYALIRQIQREAAT